MWVENVVFLPTLCVNSAQNQATPGLGKENKKLVSEENFKMRVSLEARCSLPRLSNQLKRFYILTKETARWLLPVMW